jgi:hypothetical protein
MLRSYCLLIGEYFGTDSTNQIVEITACCQRLARMVVSKKTLSLMRGIPIKCEASGQGAPQSSQAFYCVFSPAVTTYFKLPFSSNSNLDLISVLELQGFDNSCGKPDGQAVSPFGYLHTPSWIYIAISISALPANNKSGPRFALRGAPHPKSRICSPVT